MSFSETISPFFGRCAFVWFYLTSALDILGNWHGIVADMASKHVPIPPLVLLVVLVFILHGLPLAAASAITPAMARCFCSA